MTPKQLRFVDEYLVDLNATQAAIRAGYSSKRANMIGHEILMKPDIAAAIREAQRARSARTCITSDRVLSELARVAFFDVRRLVDEAGAPRSLQGLDEDTARAVIGLDVVRVGNAETGVGEVLRFKLADKTRALELLMRHLGMLEKDNHQRNAPGAFDAGKFFADLFRRPGGDIPPAPAPVASSANR